MARVERPATAFSLGAGQRRPRVEAAEHLAWIRGLPSVISNSRPCEAAHIRFGSLRHGKRSIGMQEKPDDVFCVPLTSHEHRTGKEAQHAGNEKKFWERYGIDPLDIALRLWAASGDDERGELIIRESRRGK